MVSRAIAAGLILLLLLAPGLADDDDPSFLSPAFEKATRLLLEIGMPDPSGLPYREVVVCPGSISTGGGEPIRVRGFVLPDPGNGESRKAICWNGLVYEVTEIGKPVDLTRDLLERIRRDAERMAQKPEWDRSRELHGCDGYGSSERDTLDQDRVYAIDACLLLLRGERKLAEAARATWLRLVEKDDELFVSEPFIALARDRLWLLWEQALCHHMRGEAEAALRICRALPTAWKKVTAVAKREGLLEEFQNRTSPPEQLQELTADLERRLEGPDPEQSVHPRIADLENITRIERHGTFGYSYDDPRFLALIVDESVSAAALIDCLENDDRLSRYVYIEKTGGRRTVKPVYAIAEWALDRKDLRAGGLAYMPASREMRKALATRLRAELAVQQTLPGAERYFRILLTDEAETDWMGAADRLVSREWTPGPMFGESLRERRSPSLGEVLFRRAEESRDNFAIIRQMALYQALARWDASTHQDVLKAEFERWQEHMEGIEHPPKFYPLPEYVAISRHLVALAVALDGAGDTEALERYGSWFRRMPPEWVWSSSPVPLAPLWTHAAHPAMQELGEWFAESKDSRWMRFLEQSGGLREALEEGLLLVPGVRREMIRSLSDPEWVGKKRRCDRHAMALGSLGGAPAFDRNASVKERSRACRELAAFLTAYGDRIARREYGDLGLTFPALGRPASPEDVAAGRAIFSLPGEATSIEVPRDYLWASIGPEERGRIVQIEETIEDGQVVRYLGLVERHSLVRVRASQVRLVHEDFGFEPITDRLQCRIARLWQQRAILNDWLVFTPREPVPVAVDVFNASAFSTDLDAGALELTLVRAEGPPDREATPWVPVGRKRFEPDPDAGGPMGIAEERRILRIPDLHEHFDLTGVGTYRIRISFPGLPAVPQDGVLLPHRIVVTR